MIPKDYKRTYTTYDNVAVDPTDDVWVAKVDIDSGDFVPQLFKAKQAEDAGERFYFSNEEACAIYCEEAND